MRSRKGLIAAGVAVALAFGVYVYASPYLDSKSLREAARAGDVDLMNKYVDFPALRESLRSQMTVMITKKLAEDSSMRDNPFAALGQMLAVNMVNTMVDNVVSAEGMRAMMISGMKDAVARGVTPAQMEANQADIDARATGRYKAYDIFVMTLDSPTQGVPASEWVFRRRGLVSWQLNSIRFPDMSAMSTATK